MPKTKDGGWLLDDRPMFTPEQEKEFDMLLQAGRKEEAAALWDKAWKEQQERLKDG